MTVIEVREFTDPACSWAWGTEPKLRRLQWRYGDRLAWRRILGGLIGDIRNLKFAFEATDPGRWSEYFRDTWLHTRMSYPPELKWIFSSSVPAGKAVKAAERQSDEIGGRVLRRLRERTYIWGEPPDGDERVLAGLDGVDGLDLGKLTADLGTPDVEEAFQRDWEETRRPNEYVMNLEGDRPGIGRAKCTEGHWRFVFPTVIFSGPGGEATVPGWEPWEAYEAAMEVALPGSTVDPRPDPTPDQYFDQWATACDTELAFLCGPGAEPPAGIVTHNWGEGMFLTRG